jgi:hypothetical protein
MRRAYESKWKNSLEISMDASMGECEKAHFGKKCAFLRVLKA